MQTTTPQKINFLTTSPQTQKTSLFQDPSGKMEGHILECMNTHTNFVENDANLTFQEQEQQQNTVQVHSQVPVSSQITLPQSLDTTINAAQMIELRSPDIRDNLDQYQTLLQVSSQTKQKQLIYLPSEENEQNKPSYYIGDDDSNQQEELSPDKNSDDIIAEISEQQSDQNLQLDSDEVDSEDQDFSDDEYPEDYDSDSDSETDFESLFRNSRSGKLKNQAQFLKRYQQVKNELQLEDLMLRQQQMIFGGMPMPRQMQLRKIKVSQFLLSLINNNYVKRLKIGQAKRKKLNQLHSQDYPKTGETEQPSICAQLPKKGPKEIKSVKKVVFSENIQAKVYKNDEEVNIINQAEEINEILNSAEKTFERYITILPTSNRVPIKQPNQEQLSSNELMRKFQQTIRKIVPQNANQTNQIVSEQKVGFQLSQDLKSNDTNSSEEVFDQQGEFAAPQKQTQQQTVLLNDKQLECSQETSQAIQIQPVYFSQGEAQNLIAK